MSTILIVANQTLPSEALATTVSSRIASGHRDFHVVVPATPPPGGGMTWDEDAARAAAEERLAGFQGQLANQGVTASGRSAIATRSRPSVTRPAVATCPRSSFRRSPRASPAGSARTSRVGCEGRCRSR